VIQVGGGENGNRSGNHSAKSGFAEVKVKVGQEVETTFLTMG
jgi:hypothetical protein